MKMFAQKKMIVLWFVALALLLVVSACTDYAEEFKDEFRETYGDVDVIDTGATSVYELSCPKNAASCFELWRAYDGKSYGVETTVGTKWGLVTDDESTVRLNIANDKGQVYPVDQLPRDMMTLLRLGGISGKVEISNEVRSPFATLFVNLKDVDLTGEDRYTGMTVALASSSDFYISLLEMKDGKIVSEYRSKALNVVNDDSKKVRAVNVWFEDFKKQSGESDFKKFLGKVNAVGVTFTETQSGKNAGFLIAGLALFDDRDDDEESSSLSESSSSDEKSSSSEVESSSSDEKSSSSEVESSSSDEKSSSSEIESSSSEENSSSSSIESSSDTMISGVCKALVDRNVVTEYGIGDVFPVVWTFYPDENSPKTGYVEWEDPFAESSMNPRAGDNMFTLSVEYQELNLLGKMVSPTLKFEGVEIVCNPIKILGWCGEVEKFDPNTHFCDTEEIEVHELCNGKKYKPSEETCGNDGNVYGICGGKKYDVSKYECEKDDVLGTCGSKKYNVEFSYCNDDDEIHSLCNGEPIDDSKYFCNDKNQVELLCNGVKYPSDMSCEDGVPRGILVDSRGVSSQKYSIVKIGEQVWMAENLRFYESSMGTTAKKRSDDADGSKYGYFYQWATVVDCESISVVADRCSNSVAGSFAIPRKGICPEGWHVPDSSEFAVLVSKVGPAVNMASSTEYWLTSENGTEQTFGNDLYGLNVLPSGFFSPTSGIKSDHYVAQFWTSGKSGMTKDTQVYSEQYAPLLWINGSMVSNRYSSGSVRNDMLKTDYKSVRCIKD
ncbi:MAG: hypothetical protein MJY93_05295 [Fibrobacter sp.]|nr:hypothetical protein [Fibrobacter sp.]